MKKLESDHTIYLEQLAKMEEQTKYEILLYTCNGGRDKY